MLDGTGMQYSRVLSLIDSICAQRAESHQICGFCLVYFCRGWLDDCFDMEAETCS